MNTEASITLRRPENAAALTDLVAMRAYLLARPVGSNIPAGSKDGMGYMHQALMEVNASIAHLVHADLVKGERWNGGY
jgi:hypothetical protein